MRPPARPIALAVLLAMLATGLAGANGAAARRASARGQVLDLTVRLALVPATDGTLHYKGTMTGPPFARGTARVDVTISGAGSSRIGFVLATARGTVAGTGQATTSYDGTTATTTGTARITRGTGAYDRVRASGLHIFGRSRVGDVRSRMRLTGRFTS